MVIVMKSDQPGAGEKLTMTTATFTLPLLTLPNLTELSDNGIAFSQPDRAPLRIEWVERRGQALHPSPLSTAGDVLALNLAKGCMHRCGFCAARAYANYPGDGVIQVYSGTPHAIEDELAARRNLPRAVFISPAGDPFPPSSEVQAETVRVVHVLAKFGVEAWLMTRGFIRPFALKALAEHRDCVKVLVGLTTLDRDLQRLLERGAASPSLRLRTIARLIQSGIRVHAALDPLIPDLTDTQPNLEPVLKQLALLGVKQATAGYMFLRSGIESNLKAVLQPRGLDEFVFSAYADGPILAAEGIAPARYLPVKRRRRGYAGLMALASRYGINIQVSAPSNPDFACGKVERSQPAQTWLRFRSSGQAIGG
jgi:DNA repair photolyase